MVPPSAAAIAPPPTVPPTALPTGYPAARASAQVDDYFGIRVADPFRWLEDGEAAETRTWLAAQRVLADAALGAIPGRAAIREHMTSLWDAPVLGAPRRAGDVIFHLDRAGGADDEPALYVQDRLDGPARFVLAGDALPAGSELATVSLSDDGRRVAYGAAPRDDSVQEIRVRDVRSGADLRDTLRRVSRAPVAWTKDGRGFFYAAAAVARGTGERVLYHRLGRSQSEDRVILERPDHPEWTFATTVSDDGHYAVISIRARSASAGGHRGSPGTLDERNRLYFIDLDNPGRPDVAAPVVRLFDQADATYDFVTSDAQTFVVRTTKSAPRGQLVAVDINAPHEGQWRCLVGQSLDQMVQVARVGDRFVVHAAHGGRSMLRLFALDGAPRGAIDLPGVGMVGELYTRAGDHDFFFTWAPPIAPPSVYHYDLDDRLAVFVRAPRLGVDPWDFETRQVTAIDAEGVEVPLWITTRRGVAADGTNAALLDLGGDPTDPVVVAGTVPPLRWSPAALTWVEMGGAYVTLAELGRTPSREDDVRVRTRRTVADALAAAEYLGRQGIASPRRLALVGAGERAQAVGLAIVRHPDRFAAAATVAGTFDVLRSATLSGEAWRQVVSAAHDSAAFRALLAFSPPNAVRADQRYPALLATAEAGRGAAHTYKLVATLQSAAAAHDATQAPSILLRETGNGAGTGPRAATTATDAARREIAVAADRLAFLAHVLALDASGLSPSAR